MDSCSIDSEDNSDPLDFLRPPVKRFNTLFNKNLPLEIVNFKSEFFKGFCKTNSTAVGTTVQPSRSLIFKKPLQTQVSEQYSFAHHTKKEVPSQNYRPKIIRNKPLIKVTVIPKTDQIQNRKLYRKQRYIPQKVQSTSSNQENFIQSKNVYLVIAGRNKEKIYEVRATGSAEFPYQQAYFNQQDEEAHLTKVSNFKQLIHSLNMDKKKKKDKRPIKNDAIQQTYNLPRCSFINERVCVNEAMTPAPSRVRIYGQFGINANDNYVLNYGALVNDKPVMPDVTKLGNEFTSGFVRHNNERNQRDSNVQADFGRDCFCEQPFNMDVNTGKGSQGTQVNFNIQFAKTNELKLDNFKDNKIQCSCSNVISDAVINPGDEEFLGCQSPLVVISVYPKPNILDAVKSGKPVGNKPKQMAQNSSTPNRKLNVANSQVTRTQGLNKEGYLNIARSRSPSPPTLIVGNTKKTTPESPQMNKLMRERKSPGTALRPIKDRIQEKEQQITSQQKSKISTPTAASVLRRKKKPNTDKPKPKEMGVNTDYVQAKKALVESFTKNMSSRMQPKRLKPSRNDTSKVTINIDGEKEHYDLLFNRGELTTDLSIRKTLKDVGIQKTYSCCKEQTYDSLENLLFMSNEKPRTGSLSVAYNDNQSREGITGHVSRFTIRDSLEICHRRDDKLCQGTKNVQTSSAAQSDTRKQDTEFLAPIKHFTGDDCCIHDPMARDREIRQLLGVDNLRASNTKSQQNHSREKIDEVSYHYLFRRNCRKDLVTGVSLCPASSAKPSASAQFDQQNVGTESFPADPSQPKSDIEDKQAIERTSLYQQLILNRNVQVFLQVEQFTKQKPIILTRKQYEKVRRTIQRTISKTNHKKKHVYQESYVSIGEVKKKKKTDKNLISDKQVQTEITQCVKRMIDGDCTKCGCDSIKIKEEIKQSINMKTPRRQEVKEPEVEKKHYFHKPIGHDYNDFTKGDNVDIRKTISSVEVRYANVAYGRHVTFSSKGEFILNPSLEQKNSFLTIFRGHRKTPTPNLGTSAYSLDSEELSAGKSVKVLMKPRAPQARKPLLRRLMSCLVMRSTRESKPKLLEGQTTRPKTVESSLDSYYISSSLAGIEVSSSIYDTSASFYSNHTIYPVNSKMKRGFLSSVRGFLSNRRS